MAQNKRFNTAPAAPKAPVILLTGGGSGGHITPLLAVADELKRIDPRAKLIFVGQSGDKLSDVPAKHNTIASTYSVRAGKFRRYHGEGLKQILDFQTLAKNIRDLFNVIIGFSQALRMLGKVKPSVIFVRGGYVGVPVCLAAALRKIPYVTHDSDVVPGLTNRIISRWATAHAVALPKKIYKYPPDKTFTVGVPVSSKFHPVSQDIQNTYKRELGLTKDNQVLFITGGGHGAQVLNETVADLSPELLANNPNLIMIHATGRDHEKPINSDYTRLLTDKSARRRVIVKGFFEGDLYRSSGAADVIIARAGATNIAEFAAQHKCCIIVPNPVLASGHQLKNAQYLAKQEAVVIVNDSDLTTNPTVLQDHIQALLDDPKKRQQLGKRLGDFAKPRAAKELAELLLDTIT